MFEAEDLHQALGHEQFFGGLLGRGCFSFHVVYG
jgi:hypothetical protein